MTSRLTAVTAGIVAGIAMGLFMSFDWPAAARLMGLGDSIFAPSLIDPMTRTAWSVSIVAVVFVAVTLALALVAGLKEAMVARARIDRLRHDPILADRWAAADWRAAFAQTPVADRAEAIVAAFLPPSDRSDQESRRVLADPVLLIDLEQIWLHRASLARMTGPLAGIVLGFGAVLALMHSATSAGGWQMPLAAGVFGWVFISLSGYLVGVLLAPAIEAAVRSATASVRPLGPGLALELIQRLAGRAYPETAATLVDSGPIVATLKEEMAAPLGKLAQSADRIEDSFQQRDEAIRSALDEIRAGIERLMAASPSAGAAAADPGELAETVRQALAEQNAALMQTSQELQVGLEQVAESRQALVEAAGNAERQSVLLAELTRTVEGLATRTVDQPAAAALKNLLREFDG